MRITSNALAPHAHARVLPIVAVLTLTRLESSSVDDALLAPLSELTAGCLFEEECEVEFKRRILTAATRDDLESTYFGPGRRQESAIGRSLLVCAEEDGRIVGACGLQVLILTPSGRGENQLRTRTDWQAAKERPILANLVVSSDRRFARTSSCKDCGGASVRVRIAALLCGRRHSPATGGGRESESDA